MLINFPQRIDPEINQQVIQLNQYIINEKLNGVEFTIPAYCSLLISFNPSLINFSSLKKLIFTKAQETFESSQKEVRKINLPVCYDAPYALDMDEISSIINLSPTDIVQLHTEAYYTIYMMGFLPGFPYMGINSQELNLPRKQEPRTNVPAGSVAITGGQTGIYPMNSPGGWQIIGRTPVSIFNPDRENPFLFKTGDLVRFSSIKIKEFHRIESQQEAGNYNWSELYE